MEKVIMIGVSLGELKEIIKECVREVMEEPKEKLERYYTSNEVLEILKISRTTLHSLEKKGVIKHSMIGGRKRYLMEDLEKAVVEF